MDLLTIALRLRPFDADALTPYSSYGPDFYRIPLVNVPAPPRDRALRERLVEVAGGVLPLRVKPTFMHLVDEPTEDPDVLVESIGMKVPVEPMTPLYRRLQKMCADLSLRTLEGRARLSPVLLFGRHTHRKSRGLRDKWKFRVPGKWAVTLTALSVYRGDDLIEEFPLGTSSSLPSIAALQVQGVAVVLSPDPSLPKRFGARIGAAGGVCGSAKGTFSRLVRLPVTQEGIELGDELAEGYPSTYGEPHCRFEQLSGFRGKVPKSLEYPYPLPPGRAPLSAAWGAFRQDVAFAILRGEARLAGGDPLDLRREELLRQRARLTQQLARVDAALARLDARGPRRRLREEGSDPPDQALASRRGRRR